jgi:hypothetical protein
MWTPLRIAAPMTLVWFCRRRTGAYPGGQRSGGKRWRGAAGKTPIVVAVATSVEDQPGAVETAPGASVPAHRDREVDPDFGTGGLIGERPALS